MLKRRDDASYIISALEGDLEGILSKYWHGWKKVRESGHEIALVTPRFKTNSDGKKSKRETSSFRVNLSGDKRGQWYRFSRSVGGGILDLLVYGKTGREPTVKDKEYYREAFYIARQHLGLEDDQETTEQAAERDKRNKEQREQKEREAAQRRLEAAAYDEKRVLTAAEIWKGTIPLKGSHGEAYLINRGLPPISEWPWCPDKDLRLHPSLRYEMNGTSGMFPCIVGRVADSYNKGSAIWRVYLDKEKPDKADVPNAKLGLGPSSGGAVRLGGISSRIGIAEGIESALAAWVLLGFKYPVWAGLSTSGMRSFEPPMEVERISIVPDSDRGLMDRQGQVGNPPGINAAMNLKARMDQSGIRCNVLEIPGLGDALDLLNTRRAYE